MLTFATPWLAMKTLILAGEKPRPPSGMGVK